MAKSKKAWNYVVMKSGFGDYWVGKIQLPVDNKSVFGTFDAAIEEAISRTDSKENTLELEDALESEVEPIRKAMEKWIA